MGEIQPDLDSSYEQLQDSMEVATEMTNEYNQINHEISLKINEDPNLVKELGSKGYLRSTN